MSPKERFLSALRDPYPRWIGDPWSCFNCTPDAKPSLPDAVSAMLGRPAMGEIRVKDAWGVEWDFPVGQAGPIPHVTDDTKVIKDVVSWQDAVAFPSLDNLDWEASKGACGALDRDNKLVLIPSVRGMFEFSHAMMGFEDALCNYIQEPEAMYALLDKYTDWKIDCARLIIDEMQPDFILNFDDWGNKTRLFIPPAVWRRILKPLYKRYFDYIHSRNVLVMNHCDCFAEELTEDMVDIGVDVWQGPTPENDIPGVIHRAKGKILLIGGIDMSSIDFEDAPEYHIREHIRRTIDRYAGEGHFLPCFTSIRPISERVMIIGADEMNRYGDEYVHTHFNPVESQAL